MCVCVCGCGCDVCAGMHAMGMCGSDCCIVVIGSCDLPPGPNH